MQEIHEQLRDSEHRLERMLASGWRHAGADRDELHVMSDELSAVGMPQLAERLREVAVAGPASTALHQIALALSALHLARARLDPPNDVFATGELVRTPEDSLTAQLALIAPIQVDGAERCAAIRLQRGIPTELVLLDADGPGLDSGVPASSNHGRPTKGAQPPQSPWLRATVEAELAWQASLPLGSGLVHLCAASGEALSTIPEDRHDLLSHFRERLREGKLQDEEPVFRMGGPLRVLRVSPNDVPGYLWSDPSAADCFSQRAHAGDWMLAWLGYGSPLPLALLQTGGIFHKAALQPLVPSTRAIPIAE